MGGDLSLLSTFNPAGVGHRLGSFPVTNVQPRWGWVAGFDSAQLTQPMTMALAFDSAQPTEQRKMQTVGNCWAQLRHVSHNQEAT